MPLAPESDMSLKMLHVLLLAGALPFAALAAAPDTSHTSVASNAAHHRDIEVHIGAYAPSGPASERTQHPGARAWTTPAGGTAYLAHALTIRGTEIESITASTGPEPMVEFALTAKGGAKLRALTEANVGKALGIVVNGELQSIATIRGPFGKQFQLSAITPDHAKALAETLAD